MIRIEGKALVQLGTIELMLGKIAVKVSYELKRPDYRNN